MEETGRYAADCIYLRYSIVSDAEDGPVVALCEHVIRSGFRCVGPFLDQTSTVCRLWERRDRGAAGPSAPRR